MIVLAGLVASAPIAATEAQPIRRPMPPPVIHDGDPTPDACARLGFAPDAARDEYRGRLVGSVASSRPTLPPTYAPPPPPPPPSAAPMQEMSVTASKRMAPPGYPYSPPPGSIDTERYPDAVANPVKRVAEEPVSTFSIDVDTAAYSNVRRFLNDGRKPPSDAVRVEELVNYFDYGYPLPASRAEPFRPYVAVTPSPWSQDRQIIHIGLQGYELPASDQPPLNLVFLVDTSGSMWSEDRLPLAQKALGLLIDKLRPQDRVSLVAYAGSAGAVLGPTDGRQKLKIRCAVNALRSGGSTAGGEGLALAYSLAQQNFRRDSVNRVLLLTDGDFNVGIADPERLKDFVADKRKTGVYLSVYGFGRGNYQDLMMQALAQNGNGIAAYIDTLSEARKLLRDDVAASMFPIADDVKIQVEFNPARVSEYRLIGSETRLLNREDFNNDKVDAGEVGSGASVTALYEITPAGARPSSDPLRYGRRGAPASLPTGELAFLKVRYKLPGQPTSKLMERPITPRDAYASAQAAPESTRWALAVAGFGQKLRGDPWVADSFGWSRIGQLAQGARGDDPYGLRAEFVQLVRNADEARSVNDRS
ncbi:MAG: VWA domain-containing protein [Caulobacteraceae bacterium]|nr:VWA domain-containing protein [Caulobacteraceae bacterium]